MIVVRFLGLFAGLFLLALGVAYFITRDARYARIAWRTMQALVLLFVALGLLYVFERVLLML